MTNKLLLSALALSIATPAIFVPLNGSANEVDKALTDTVQIVNDVFDKDYQCIR